MADADRADDARPPLHRRLTRAGIAWTLVPAVAAGTIVAALFTGEPAAPAVKSDGPASALAQMADVGPEPPRYLDRPHPRTIGIGPAAARPPRPARRPARPVRLRIPSVRVRARIVPVRTRHRRLAIPPVTRAGWYKAGARPGEPGHTVIVGHIDSYRGPGVFARLGRVRRGSRILVVDRRGYVRRFRVVGTTVVPKARFPTHAVFGPSRHSVLVLVTCGGPFRGARRGYKDNVIVFASAQA
jgi:hypothetical protein